MQDKNDTTVQGLLRACQIGVQEGLHFVYAGNLPRQVGAWEDTACPGCKTVLVKRSGYCVVEYHLKDGTCSQCHRVIPGVWEPPPRRSAKTTDGPSFF